MLGHFHRRSSHAVLILLLATGLAHWVLHDWFQTQGEFGVQPNPLEPWMLRLHGAAAMLGLMVFGSLFQVHVRRFWRLGRNRRAGGTFLACALLLIGSGYGLYYLGGETSRALCRQLHIVIGVAALPAFLVHWWRGRILQHRHAAQAGGVRA